MNSLDNATVVDSNVFSAIAGDAHEAVFEYRLTMPFQVDKAHKAAHEDEDDVENCAEEEDLENQGGAFNDSDIDDEDAEDASEAEAEEVVDRKRRRK